MRTAGKRTCHVACIAPCAPNLSPQQGLPLCLIGGVISRRSGSLLHAQLQATLIKRTCLREISLDTCAFGETFQECWSLLGTEVVKMFCEQPVLPLSLCIGRQGIGAVPCETCVVDDL